MWVARACCGPDPSWSVWALARRAKLQQLFLMLTSFFKGLIFQRQGLANQGSRQGLADQGSRQGLCSSCPTHQISNWTVSVASMKGPRSSINSRLNPGQYTETWEQPSQNNPLTNTFCFTGRRTERKGRTHTALSGCGYLIKQLCNWLEHLTEN